jgi:hypothetical protein
MVEKRRELKTLEQLEKLEMLDEVKKWKRAV